MTLTVAIQDVLVPHTEVVKDLEACARIDMQPVCFGLIPFSDEITCETEGGLDKPAIPFGSTKLIKLWLQKKAPKNWHIFYDPQTFDQSVYGPLLDDLALNADPDVKLLGEVKHLKQHVTPLFVKPASDLKAFAGMVIEPGQSIAERLAETTQDCSLSDSEQIIIAPTQIILEEFRCYMRGPRMMGASRYKTGNRPTCAPVTNDEHEELWMFAYVVAKKWVPAAFYALDVARTPTGFKVVEFNCINCSGRYAADRGRLFKETCGIDRE